MSPRLRRRLAGLLLVVLLGLGAFYALLYSEAGLRWGLALAERALPGELTITRMEGRLAGPLRLDGLSYRSPALDIQAASLALDWRPWRLMDAELHLAQLEARELSILTRPAPEPPPERTPARDTPPELRLPLDVVVDTVRIDGLEIRQVGEDEGYRLEAVHLQALWRDQALRVQTLEVAAPGLQVRAEGRLQPQGNYPLTLDVDWQLSRDEQDWFGSGMAEGNLSSLHLTQRLAGVLEVELDAQLHGLLDPDALSAEGAARIKSAYGPVTLHFALAREATHWRIPVLTAELPGGGTVQGSATLTTGEHPQAQVEARWEALAWPLADETPMLDSPQGELRLTGWLDAYDMELQAALARRPDLALGRWELHAHGDTQALDVTALKAQILDGQLEGTGQFAWTEGLDWRLQLTGHGLDPAAVLPDWPGALDLALTHTGALQSGKLTTETRLEMPENPLRGHRFAAALHARTHGPDVELESARIRQGSNRLDLSGRLADRWDLEWELEAPALDTAYPDARGRLQAHGRLSGPRARPHLQAVLEGADLGLADAAVTRLSGELSVNFQPEEPSAIELQATGLQLAQRRLDARLHGQGRLPEHQLQLTVQTDDSQLLLSATGGLENDAWDGRLQRADLLTRAFGDWRLTESAALRLHREALALATSCWQSDAGRVCAQGDWDSAQGFGAQIDAQRVSLGLLQPLLPQGLTLPGRAEAQMRLRFGTETRALEGRLVLPASELRYTEESERQHRLRYADLVLELATRERALIVDLELPLPELGAVNGHVELPAFWDAPLGLGDQPLQGTLTAQLETITPFAALVPALYEPEAQLEAALRLGGTLAAPRPSGQLVLRNGSTRLPQLGVSLEKAELRLRDTPQGDVEVTGSAESGGGRLHIEGRFGLDVIQGGTGRLSITGQEVQVANLPEATVFASPQLELSAADRRLHITGTVTVPRADIRISKYEAAVSPSSDVIIIDESLSDAAREPLWQLVARVRLILGDAVRVEGFGLMARVTGEITAMETPDRPTLAEGELRVAEGKYEIYGRKLDITEGRLMFAGGPVTNPGIEARAMRRLPEVAAGVRVSGDLRDPKVELVSEPMMDDSDVLSYIVLGRPLNAASQSEGELLYQAARSLGLAGGGLLTQRLQSVFDLDVATIESTDTGTGTQEPALVLGKYLSPRLYVGYAVSLFENREVLQFRYQIDRNWRLQTETGTTSGWDLIYSIER